MRFFWLRMVFEATFALAQSGHAFGSYIVAIGVDDWGIEFP